MQFTVLLFSFVPAPWHFNIDSHFQVNFQGLSLR